MYMYIRGNSSQTESHHYMLSHETCVNLHVYNVHVHVYTMYV